MQDLETEIGKEKSIIYKPILPATNGDTTHAMTGKWRGNSPLAGRGCGGQREPTDYNQECFLQSPKSENDAGEGVSRPLK